MSHAPRRIVILCEGETEVLATRHLLRRQFHSDGLASIGLQPIDLEGKLEDVFDKVPRFRKDRGVVAVFVLIDLAGMRRVQHAPDASLDDKVAAVRGWLVDGVQDADPDFFHPHVCVHELEAWFLAEGHALGKRIAFSKLEPDAHAEQRNLDHPPSRWVNDLFRKHRKRSYHKTRDARPIFDDLSHVAIYKHCKYYREFYDDLTSVARAPRSM